MLAVKPRDLTEEEKEQPYAKLFYREPAKLGERQKVYLESGKMLDSKYAILPGEFNEKLADVPEAAETGYCYLPDGGAYVAGRHDMPGITEDMYRYWLYWWNVEAPAQEQLRYKCWCPKDHHNASFKWSSENVGPYLLDFFILDSLRDQPEKLGIKPETFEQGHIIMLDGVNAQQKYINEDLEQQPIPAVVTHMLYEKPDGVVMRSRFWIGYQAIGGKLVNICGSRRLVSEDMLRGLLEHNSIEMNGLRDIMPILYHEFRKKEDFSWKRS